MGRIKESKVTFATDDVNIEDRYLLNELYRHVAVTMELDGYERPTRGQFVSQLFRKAHIEHFGEEATESTLKVFIAENKNSNGPSSEP